MNKTLRITFFLVVIITIVASASLLLSGMAFGRSGWDLNSGLRSYQSMTSSLPYGSWMGPGMSGSQMNGFDFSSPNGGSPLSLEDAEATMKDYIDRLGSDEFTFDDVMIFENHANARSKKSAQASV